ncbi:MAG: thioredoxin family protein [Muribaculaceae bacterium]|nr:thioredoxin family protein [Muribaculaceae bacterium]
MEYDEMTRSNNVVLVEFFATWCPHCQKMMPVVNDLKALIGKQATVCQLDIDLNREAADAENVDSLPTFILYHNGKEKWRHTGEIDGETLLAKIEWAAGMA